MTPAELRRIMKQQGWTQIELARLLPLKSTRTIRYWLSGKREIRPLVAERIRGCLQAEQKVLKSLRYRVREMASRARVALPSV
jgi:transcriptional regulator with XRE-family HTH domain